MADLKDLRLDHRNARKRTKRSSALIAESLKQFGAARSIVIDENNRVLAGNGTLEGAKAAGIQSVRIVETDGTELIAVRRSGLSEDEKVGLALADNRAGDLSAWDSSMLQQLAQDHDISPWFEPEDITAIIQGPDPDASHDDGTDIQEPEQQDQPIGPRTPLAIILTAEEMGRWKKLKQSIGVSKDKTAFLALLDEHGW
jgi:hypothetical protein